MTWKLLAIVPISLLSISGAISQGIGLPSQARQEPVEILADNGIEWHREAQAYIAHGNAKARQGDVTVHANQLTAFYEKGNDGTSQIWRIDADGNVRITSPTQTAYGDKGVYQVTKGVFILTGSPRLITQTDKITAQRSLEFYEHKSLAVARGEAVTIRGDKRLRADVLSAHFVKRPDGKNEVDRVDAYDNVMISSPEEIITSKRGIYYTKTGIIFLRGSVKITRGKDQLNGETAEVNLNTGISRLLSGGTKQVRGIFQPKNSSLVRPAEN